MRLLSVTLLRDRVSDWSVYPFTVPAIRTLETLEFRSRVCFFVGENGSGKSSLIEAIAGSYGFGREGGTRNFQMDTTASNSAIQPLSKALRIAFTKRTGFGFYLRAESFFNIATEIDRIGVHDAYGGLSRRRDS